MLRRAIGVGANVWRTLNYTLSDVLYIERCAHHAKSVTTVVRVSITATVPNNVMGGIRLRHMSPSPDLLELN